MKTIMRLAYTALIIGIALCVAGLAMGGTPQANIVWSGKYPHIVTKQIVTTTEETTAASAVEDTGTGRVKLDAAANTSGVTGAYIEIGAATATINVGDNFSITAPSGAQYTESVSDGVWRLETETAQLLSFGNSEPYFITLPKELENVTLVLGAGKMTVNELSCNTLAIQLGMGSMMLNNINCPGGSTLDVGMGSLELDGTLLSQNIIDCGMGSIKATITAPGDYGYIVDCGVGHTRIGDKSYNGIADVTYNEAAPNMYNIDCGVGSVDILFK